MTSKFLKHEIRFPRHASISAFGVERGELLVNGVPVRRLAERVGRTPFYAYDRSAIRARIERLRAVIPNDIQLHYAIKANPMPAIVQLLATLADGLDVASAREMQIALDTGTPPREISFAGPGKTASEIAQAVAAGIVINLESVEQFEHARQASERTGVAARVAVRVNPDFELKQSGMRMGGGAKPFGVDQSEVPALLDRIEESGLELGGLHIYSGSQNLSCAAITDSQHKAVALAIQLLAGRRSTVRWVNIGGGFGVPYFPGDPPLALDRIGSGLQACSETARSELGVPLVLELGRYMVAEAGVYVTRVIDRKVSHGQTFLVVDGGLHHHLAASGNFGQVIRKNYPIAVGHDVEPVRRETQSVVGPLCTPLDLLGDRVDIARASVGDLIVVFQSGAYGPSASPQGFLSHPPPAEVLV